MNDFVAELRDLIDKWLNHPTTDKDEIINALMDAIEDLEPDMVDDL